jgi:hypothetical protein
MFIGLTANTAAFANNANIAAQANSIGIGQVFGSNNLQIITNAAAASASLVDTGLRCNVGNTNIYDASMFCPPGAAWVRFKITELSNTANTFSANVTSNLPANNTFLAYQAWRCSNTTAAICALDMVSVYSESDN